MDERGAPRVADQPGSIDLLVRHAYVITMGDDRRLFDDGAYRWFPLVRGLAHGQTAWIPNRPAVVGFRACLVVLGGQVNVAPGRWSSAAGASGSGSAGPDPPACRC